MKINRENKKLIYRYLWFAVGVVINSIGVALITKANLGTSPISSVAYVLSLKLPISFGTLLFAANMVFIIVQKMLLKKEFSGIQWLQIGVNLLFSTALDITMALLEWLKPEVFLVKFSLLIMGCAVLALGISIEIAPNVLVVPGEGIVKAITKVSHKQQFGRVKVLFDVSSVGIAVCLSYIFFQELKGLGMGTVISALLIGRFVDFSNRFLPLIRIIAGMAD